jgi:hypothetical protein
MIRYSYNAQKQPPAPFVRITLRHPLSGIEIRDIPAQIDTGADQTLVPLTYVEALELDFSGGVEIVGVGGKSEEMELYTVILGIHTLPPQPIEILAHPGEAWILLGRDVLNIHRLILNGPGLVLELEPPTKAASL